MLRWAAQAAWYEAVQGTEEKFTHNGKEQVMDKAWLQAYSKANGLNAPHNAALLAEYLNTRDPQALKQLTESLKKTPRRAAIERDQQAALDKSQVVTFLSGFTGVDYRQIMMDAGNPLDIASNFIPPLRGARAASKVGGGIRRTITSAAGSVAADLALESVNQAVENPNATLDDYLANGRNTVAAALGMHTAGAATGKAAQHLTPHRPPAPDGSPPPNPQPNQQDLPQQPPGEYELAPSELNPQVIAEGNAGPPGSRPMPPSQPGAATPNPPPLPLEQVHADAVSQGLIPPIQQQGDKFIITDEEGTPAIYDNRQEAVQDALILMTPEQRQKVQAMVEESQPPKAEAKKSRLQFSHGREMEGPANTSPRTPGQAMQALAENESRFRRGPASQSKDMNEIARQYTLSDELTSIREGERLYSENSLHHFKLHFKAGGWASIIHSADGNVYVDTSKMRPETAHPAPTVHRPDGRRVPTGEPSSHQNQPVEGGDLVYQAAMTYALNNGLKFIPDPRGVSPIAKARRISQMISSAQRHKTTRHLQVAGINPHIGTSYEEVANWREEKSQADFDHNFNLLVQAEMENVEKAMRYHGETRLEDLRWNPQDDTVTNVVTRRRLSEGDFKAIVSGLDSRDSGVGATTLSRALVARHALQLDGPQSSGQHDLDTSPRLGGGVDSDQPGARLRRLLEGHNLFYSQPGRPDATRGPNLRSALGSSEKLGETLAETTRFLNEKQPGLVNQNTHLFTSVDELLASDYARTRGFDADDIAEIRTAEGFYDPDTGHSVIVAENTRLRDGETPQQAITRVVLHERASHDGLRLLLGQPDSARSRRWGDLSAKIPQQELDAIAGEKGYQHLAGKRDDLAFEWLARKTETDMSLLEKGSLPQRMWDEFREMVLDLLASVGQKPTLGRSFDMQVQDLKIRARNAALRGGQP